MKLYQQVKSKNWFYRFRIDGREYRGSTGTSSKRDAEMFMREKYVDLKRAAPAEASVRPTAVIMASRDYARARAAGRTDYYIELGLKQHWARIIEFFGDKTSYTPEELNQYVAHRRKAGVRGQSIVRELGVLKRGLTMAWEAEEIDAVPRRWPKVRSDDVDVQQRGHFHDRPLLQKWMALLHPAARDEALVALLTGLRYTELERLDPAWIEPVHNLKIVGILHLPRTATKTKTERSIGITRQCGDAIARRAPFVADYKKHYILTSEKLGLTRRITLRDLRTTFATVTARHSGDARGVDLVMGHATGVKMRYQEFYPERLENIAVTMEAWLNGHT